MRTTFVFATPSLLSIFSLPVCAAEKTGEGWVSLFDGKTLEGWSQKNGTATYRVEDGADSRGKPPRDSPNSFCARRRTTRTSNSRLR